MYARPIQIGNSIAISLRHTGQVRTHRSHWRAKSARSGALHKACSWCYTCRVYALTVVGVNLPDGPPTHARNVQDDSRLSSRTGSLVSPNLSAWLSTCQHDTHSPMHTVKTWHIIQIIVSCIVHWWIIYPSPYVTLCIAQLSDSQAHCTDIESSQQARHTGAERSGKPRSLAPGQSFPTAVHVLLWSSCCTAVTRDTSYVDDHRLDHACSKAWVHLTWCTAQCSSHTP